MLENLSSAQQADLQAKQKIIFILKLLGEIYKLLLNFIFSPCSITDVQRTGSVFLSFILSLLYCYYYSVVLQERCSRPLILREGRMISQRVRQLSSETVKVN
jgi:hypothetical protein